MAVSKAGEDVEAALRRELREEIGCHITNIRDLGVIEEFRSKAALHQTSYCFITELDGKKGEPEFDAGEIAAGFEPMWLPLDEAIRTVQSDPGRTEYEAAFIQTRALIFLKAARDAQ